VQTFDLALAVSPGIAVAVLERPRAACSTSCFFQA
jgi:hypothetical protein